MKSILVPIDFSQNSQSAIQAAKLIAKTTGAKLNLLHAYVPFVPTEIHVPISANLYTEVEESMKASLESSREELAADGIPAEAFWVEGPVLKAVVEYADTLKADLVVIGRTGRGGFLDKLFGSVATDIVRNLECVPVLTIPPDAELVKIDRIVYATQLEHDEEDAIRLSVAFARALGAKLIFMKLNSLIQPDIQPDQQYIDPLKAEFGFTDEDFVFVDIGRNSLVEEIEQQAISLGADMLVVSAKEKSFIEEFLIDPSISKKLLLNVSMPLLSCRLTGYCYSN